MGEPASFQLLVVVFLACQHSELTAICQAAEEAELESSNSHSVSSHRKASRLQSQQIGLDSLARCTETR